jgi:hypothetical protein
MKTITTLGIKTYLTFGCLFIAFFGFSQQAPTAPQVNFTQRTAAATPTQTIYNVKGDFTLLGNTNLTLVNYGVNTDNESNSMKYVDIDVDSNTLNSSKATLELSNSGENSATQNCSTVLFAGLYWTGKSDDANETFSVTKDGVTKNYDKKTVSIKGPGASAYTTITTTTAIRFPGATNSGIFIGYQEVTDYVKTHGAGTYTVADIALIEGSNSNPGLSGGWGMVVIYENPAMKSRAVTLFDGYAYVNGQLPKASPYTVKGEYGNIDISGFTTVGTGPVNMKLGVMAAEGDVYLTGDYLAVQKLNANPAVYNTTNYLTLNHSSNLTTNFFNSSIFPFPGANSTPSIVNNTGIDISMFTIPNTDNLVIGNNQTATTFRFGSSSDVFTIFGFAMSVDAYIPEPKGLSSVNSINGVSGLTVLNALPGESISYTLSITNEGTEATNNTIITIPVPATAIINTSTISYNSYPYSGFTPTTNIPVYNSGTNTITWDLGTLPIKANTPGYKFYDLNFNLDVTTDCSVILNAGCSPEVSLENGTITGTGAISGSPFSKKFFQGYDGTTCHLPISGSIIVAIDTASCLSAMAGPNQIASCGGESVTLAATEATGLWTIFSGPAGGGEIFSNNTSPSSTFYSPNIGVYTLRWTTSCATTDDVLITFELCNVINFDGTDDHINFKNEFNLNSGTFSIEAWIKSGAVNSNTQTIISKRFSTSSTDGYDLRLVNNSISFNWNNGNAITSTYPIDSNRWYHIAVTFSGSNYNLYVDGILVAGPISGANPTSNSVNFIVGAMDQNNVTPFNYFNGWMDELRIWNTTLTVDQIHQMMNQEIQDDGSGNIEGAIVPKNITGLTWSNLNGYYQMNGETDIINGYLVDKATTPINGKIKNIYTPQPETAPLPYTSRANGAWETDASWTNYPVWDVPYSFGIDGSTKIDWNIVETSHNIISNGNKTVLGLLVNNNTLSAVNDSKIEVSSYLKLGGTIDLVGMSQLLQTTGSDLDVTSDGSLERDQQGQTNLYNYNYWCSPVSTINETANNTDYTITDIMKDGTNSTPQNINWIGGYDGAATSPISIARYWLYTLDNYINEYASWNQILETTPIRVGQGYTMKGSGAEGGTQNYTFVGKPNNGTIETNTVAADQLLLTGNPYPSALDAVAFINDNSNSIDGTLYFWEHYATNYTHILRDYQGGYGQINLVGGVAAGSIPTSLGVDYISGIGSSIKGAPNRYIPVGQGFFVIGKANGIGNLTVKFNNAQRGFHKETEAGVSNIMYKTAANTKTSTKTAVNSNDPVETNVDTFKRIRLGYNSNNMFHRQVLLGFMNEKATSEIDYGYDGYNMDDFPNDMYLLNGENQLVIEGEGFFDVNASYPIGVKTDVEGKVSFIVDALENFDSEQAIFIYDNVTDTYHNIRYEKFEVIMPVGVNDTRFSLRFVDKTLKVTDTKINDIKVAHIQNGNIILINNKLLDVTVEKVTLFNILGQTITTWKIENQEQQNIQIPIKNINSGVYIAKLKTSKGNISKKIIIL